MNHTMQTAQMTLKAALKELKKGNSDIIMLSNDKKGRIISLDSNDNLLFFGTSKRLTALFTLSELQSTKWTCSVAPRFNKNSYSL